MFNMQHCGLDLVIIITNFSFIFVDNRFLWTQGSKDEVIIAKTPVQESLSVFEVGKLLPDVSIDLTDNFFVQIFFLNSSREGSEGFRDASLG